MSGIAAKLREIVENAANDGSVARLINCRPFTPHQPFEPEMTSATANEATPHNPFIGKVMGGRYQVDRLIGRGGMGLVYLAHRHTLR